MTDHKTLTEALAAFHADLPEIHKGSTNPAFKSKYADLADIVKVVLPKLAAVGLAWTATPTLQDGEFVLAYRLTHTSGEKIEGVWPLPDHTKATPQQLGSAVTYAKRYTLSAVTGIAPDEDDDGNAASAKGAPQAARRDPAKERIGKASAAIAAAGSASELDIVWDQVIRSGLDGISELKSAAAAARKSFPAPAPVDEWAVVDIPADPKATDHPNRTQEGQSDD